MMDYDTPRLQIPKPKDSRDGFFSMDDPLRALSAAFVLSRTVSLKRDEEFNSGSGLTTTISDKSPEFNV